jgi:hypothetical protein
MIYSEAYRRRLDGVAYSTYILIMLVVPLKLYCRKRSGGWRNIQWDDYISIFALLVANGFLYVCMIGMYSPSSNDEGPPSH